jgi:lipoprotein-anchoring transpeptidase ErfK/SrfK
MREHFRIPLFVLASVICLLPASFSANDFNISARIVNTNTVRIDFNSLTKTKGTELILLRSTAKLANSKVNKIRYPVTEFLIDSTQNPLAFLDQYTAHNVTYFYLAFTRKKGQTKAIDTSNPVEISIPNSSIKELDDPVILIDKKHYYLEIQNNGKTAKKYPMSLGRDPFTRKLHQDNKTTPEGLYKIINLQKKATFYKAIDINYPNTLDRIRYNSMRANGQIPNGRGIGGEIQIHGKHPRFGSIQRNWTWGCISLRNADMDEIFSLSGLKVGIPVIIFGHELTLEEAKSQEGIKGYAGNKFLVAKFGSLVKLTPSLISPASSPGEGMCVMWTSHPLNSSSLANAI